MERSISGTKNTPSRARARGARFDVGFAGLRGRFSVVYFNDR